MPGARSKMVLSWSVKCKGWVSLNWKKKKAEQINRIVSEVTVILALFRQPGILTSLEAFQTFSLLQNLINPLTVMN